MNTEKDRNRDVVIAARHRCGVNQKEFAKWLGISPQFLSQIELGDAPASANVMKNLERVLSERGIPDAIRSPAESDLVEVYRHLPSDVRTAVNSIVNALKEK
jgi:DNA-binding XRE family transcriptional regulator